VIYTKTDLLAEVVGSNNPTRSTFSCCTITVLIQVQFW
jgi:hypothetical protein